MFAQNTDNPFPQRPIGPFDPVGNPAAANDPWTPHSQADVPEVSTAPKLTPFEQSQLPHKNFPDFAPQILQTNVGSAEQNLPGSTISVDQLKNPLSRKARKLLDKARRYSHEGEHAKAIQELKQALNEPSAVPYARSMLGAELLKMKDVQGALPELEEAVLLLPDSAANHSNLGLALCLSGQTERGEREVQEALKLNGNSPQARFLIGVILLDRNTHDPAARDNFQFAQDKVRSAHLGLAFYYESNGDKKAADRALREYLGPDHTAGLPAARGWLSEALQKPPAAAFGFGSANAVEPSGVTESAQGKDYSDLGR